MVRKFDRIFPVFSLQNFGSFYSETEFLQKLLYTKVKVICIQQDFIEILYRYFQRNLQNKIYNSSKMSVKLFCRILLNALQFFYRNLVIYNHAVLRVTLFSLLVCKYPACKKPAPQITTAQTNKCNMLLVNVLTFQIYYKMQESCQQQEAES